MASINIYTYFSLVVYSININSANQHRIVDGFECVPYLTSDRNLAYIMKRIPRMYPVSVS